MKIQDSITDKNIKLFQKVRSKVSIDFELDSSETCWTLTRTGENSYKITYNVPIPSPENLTHELLHIELDLNGFLGVHEIIEDSRFAHCHPGLLAAINNNLAHFKMLNLFVKLGFDRTKFLFEISTNMEEEYFTDLKTIKPEIRVNQFVNYLLQTSIQVNWEKNWLQLDVSKVEADLISKNKSLYEETNIIIEKWKKSTTFHNFETFLELQNVYNNGLKAYR